MDPYIHGNLINNKQSCLYRSGRLVNKRHWDKCLKDFTIKVKIKNVLEVKIRDCHYDLE